MEKAQKTTLIRASKTLMECGYYAAAQQILEILKEQTQKEQEI